MQLQVTYISLSGIKSFVLPEKVSGRYWVKDSKSQNTVSIESVEQQWQLKSAKYYGLLDKNGNDCKKLLLTPMSISRIYSKKSGDRAFVFAEPITENRGNFVKYGVRDDIDLKIGKSPDCDIFYNNAFVSKIHAVLSYKSGKWYIEDNGSRNGTYVNNYYIDKVKLKPGDVVYVMGMKLIIGDNFFAVNNPDGLVTVVSDFLGEFDPPEAVPATDEYQPEPPEYFYRSPRFRREVETARIRIDSPPSDQIGEETPLMLVLGPSITMGLASLTMAVFSVYNAVNNGNLSSSIPSIAMSASMLLGTMLWPVISKKYDKNRRRRKEAKRQRKYSEYLAVKEKEINALMKRQEEILRENSVTVDECFKRIDSVSRSLWERTYGQKDFLEFRLGTGLSKFDAEIVYSERRFTLDEDNLNERMLELCERPKILKNIPVTLSLFENCISGVIGDDKQRNAFIKGLILQTVALYGKEDVKLIFLSDGKSDEFDFVKWLPHVWDDEGINRFTVSNDDEVKDISSYFERVINYRSELNENEVDTVSPYYIVFVLDKNIGVGADFLKKILSSKRNLNISTVFSYRELRDLPKECSVAVEINGADGKIYDKNNISDTVTVFKPDIFVESDLNGTVKKLANIPIRPTLGNESLPNLVTFLNMYDVGKVEHLNISERWSASDPSKSLEAFVGIDTNGKLFKLDLHEKFHGPHGLVAGMTGSGKSEFIITYILSMAVNFHPDEVAFILIDYKGGGMAKVFENLPHTAGIITNLDGSAIKRSLVSIQSELRRRQAVFAAAAKSTGVSNIDIYKYQKLRREGRVSEPLQHLFIIADEFAELKTQQPEFMEQLVSAARIGRSLGVHLMLATQKPSGVVDDQIWSNSKFRVCLKVQERSDSMDMLKRPDAAELSQTGRFYLQVGYNELFELGQSAWAGAGYYPSESNLREKDDSVEIIGRTGHIISAAKPIKSQRGSDVKKQMDAIIEHLKSVANEENIKVRELWLPPLKPDRTLSDVLSKYGYEKKDGVLEIPVGEYDDPYNQMQGLLTVPFTESGNALVYGSAGSGKTTFLTTLLYSMLSAYSPNEVRTYILDFASETLRAFENAPHVGEVMFSDSSEKIERFFDYLRNEIVARKKMFADFGGDFASYNAEAKEKCPNIVVAINNYVAFTEQFDYLDDDVALITRECTKYGIYFIMTVPNTNGVRYRMAQNFGQTFTMLLSDDSEYVNVIGKTDGLYPADFKGRGLFKNKGVFEFQTAYASIGVNSFKFIKAFCDELCVKYPKAVEKIAVVPEKVTVTHLKESYRIGETEVPVGFALENATVLHYPMFERYITLVVGNGDLPFRFSKALFDTVADENTVVIKPSDNTVIPELFDLTVKRFKEHKNDQNAVFDRKTVFINSISDIRDVLSSDNRDRLDLILEKGSADLGMNIVLTENYDKLSTVVSEVWYRRNIGDGNGIWIGRGFKDQYRINVDNRSNRFSKSDDPDKGFVVTDRKAVAVKVALSDKEW